MMDAEDIFRRLRFSAKFQKPVPWENKKDSALKAESKEKIESEYDTSDSENIDSSEENVICVKDQKHTVKDEKNDIKNEKLNELRKSLRISAVGRSIPKPIQSFEELTSTYNVSQRIVQNILNSNFKNPTPIQMQAVPCMLEGRQVLACAPTGSGKTAAFLIPVIHSLGGPKKLGFRAVIVSPTRELAKQTFRECVSLSEGTNLRIHIISKIGNAVEKFGPNSSQKFDILITTPNRLVYLLQQDPPALSLKNVEWLVVDESDKLFEVGPRGFRDQLAVIYLACTLDKVKRAMFSATCTAHVARWCRKNLDKLITITIGHRNTAAEEVKQELLFVANEEGKLLAIRDIIQQGVAPPVLVFVQSKERAQQLFEELLYDGINVEVIHADRTQLQRDNVVQAFREGKIWFLICTELMGRGIDFKGVNVVINYDFPLSAVSYIHRIGRTGRAGRSGRAITFFTSEDRPHLKSIANVMKDSGCPVTDYLLTLKRPKKEARRKLANIAPERKQISTVPSYEKFKLHKEKIKMINKKRRKEGKRGISMMPEKKTSNLSNLAKKYYSNHFNVNTKKKRKPRNRGGRRKNKKSAPAAED